MKVLFQSEGQPGSGYMPQGVGQKWDCSQWSHGEDGIFIWYGIWLINIHVVVFLGWQRGRRGGLIGRPGVGMGKWHLGERRKSHGYPWVWVNEWMKMVSGAQPVLEWGRSQKISVKRMRSLHSPTNSYQIPMSPIRLWSESDEMKICRYCCHFIFFQSNWTLSSVQVNCLDCLDSDQTDPLRLSNLNF